MGKKYQSFLCGAFSSLFLLLAGCEKYYLSICQEKVDRNYLASTHVGTPDPRQDNPPMGQMLIIDWKVPKKVLEEKPFILLHVVYWDYTEQDFTFPVEKQMGYVTYRLLNKEYEKKMGILTYKAEIVTDQHKVYKEWVHQLWVNLIRLDEVEKTPKKAPAETEPASEENLPEEPDSQEPEERHSLDEESASSADPSSSSVVDQSRQGSVIETEGLSNEGSSVNI
jgi:hypothetical protein